MRYDKINMSMKNIHPGELLRMEIIFAHQLNLTEAAQLMQVPIRTLSKIINCRINISEEMCERIAATFGGTAEIWANLQSNYNKAKRKKKRKPKVKTIKAIDNA
jgi:addiction module HigA family antidote